MSPPPRLHVILARAAPVAVVFRRGPSKQVATLLWTLRDDRLTLGQWLKGRIYPMRADLSPDGRHMICFAMNGRRTGRTRGSRTAVSRPPWLKAVALHAWGDCWTGGGLFLDNRRYRLHRSPFNDAALLEGCGAVEEAAGEAPAGVAAGAGECLGVYLPRLARDGWTERSRMARGYEAAFVHDKPVRKGWVLRKTVHGTVGGGPNRECCFETHVLAGPEEVEIPCPGWEWADRHGNDILFARAGALWRTHLTATGTLLPDRCVADLSAMTFEPREAPC